MAYPRAARSTSGRGPRRRRRTWSLYAIPRRTRQAFRTWKRAAPPARLAGTAAALLLLVAVWAAINLAYQVIRKPVELLLPVSGALMKPPGQTWRDYAPLFRRYATGAVSPELLAALAQVESAGDPVALTEWRWHFSWNPLDLYRPESSAVGMYQMTDGAFAAARRYCIRGHRVTAGCRFTGLSTRLVPKDAVELAAIYLARSLAGLGEQRRLAAAKPQQRDHVAAIVHLCGAGPAETYLQQGFRLAPHERCDGADIAAYLARVDAAKRDFARLAAAE